MLLLFKLLTCTSPPVCLIPEKLAPYIGPHQAQPGAPYRLVRYCSRGVNSMLTASPVRILRAKRRTERCSFSSLLCAAGLLRASNRVLSSFIYRWFGTAARILRISIRNVLFSGPNRDFSMDNSWNISVHLLYFDDTCTIFAPSRDR